MDQDIAYEQRRNPNLPYGYWCIADPDRYPHPVDETGKCWASLREYIWCERLGMAGGSNWEYEYLIEFLLAELAVLAVLAVIDRRTVYVEEKIYDLFEGS